LIFNHWGRREPQRICFYFSVLTAKDAEGRKVFISVFWRFGGSLNLITEDAENRREFVLFGMSELPKANFRKSFGLV